MNAFWVLFFVLLNTIGNQGDLNHGLINFETDPEDPPLYIVSLRNIENCHICTGSIISRHWILSTNSCSNVTHFLHGLREYENCNETEEGITVTKYSLWLCRTVLYKAAQKFDETVERLFMPESSLDFAPPQIEAAVVGWSFNNITNKFVMNKIAVVNITEALSNETDETFFKAFCEVGTGSPLIVDDFIYGFVRPDTCRFDDFLYDVDDVRMEINVE